MTTNESTSKIPLILNKLFNEFIIVGTWVICVWHILQFMENGWSVAIKVKKITISWLLAYTIGDRISIISYHLRSL